MAIAIFPTAKQPFKRFAAGILEQQHGAIETAFQAEWPDGPRSIQLVLKCIFVSQSIEACGWGVFCLGKHDKHSATTSAVRK